eukprot:8027607-Pyramimonas_sp.AAC.1
MQYFVDSRGAETPLEGDPQLDEEFAAEMAKLADPALDEAARTNFTNVTMQNPLGKRFYLWLLNCADRKARYDSMGADDKKKWRTEWLTEKYQQLEERA